MATPGNSSGPSGKKDRREEAREKARIAREQERKRAVRNRIFVQGGIGLAVVAIALIVVLIVVNQPKPVALSKNTTGPLNMISDGIVLSGSELAAVRTPAIAADGKPVPSTPAADKISIVTYVDYQCPACKSFEATNTPQIEKLVRSGLAELEVHPVAILDNYSQGNRYSTRAANAAVCVANYQPDRFQAVSTALYANQPEEGTAGKTDAQLLSVIKGAGAGSDKITSCVTTQRFAHWVTDATTRVGKPLPNSDVKALASTPTVIVNGTQFKGSITDPSVFAQFVAASTR
jgi:protein-disulfide isomerase